MAQHLNSIEIDHTQIVVGVEERIIGSMKLWDHSINKKK